MFLEIVVKDCSLLQWNSQVLGMGQSSSEPKVKFVSGLEHGKFFRGRGLWRQQVIEVAKVDSE